MENELKEKINLYLPHKLNCMVYDVNKSIDGEKGLLGGVYYNGSCVFHNLIESEVGFKQIKPLVRKLSSLTEPITVEGETFIPAKVLNFDEVNPSPENRSPDTEGYCFRIRNVWYTIDSLPFSTVKKLIKWHFWIFDQKDFETGRVIDVNTIER